MIGANNPLNIRYNSRNVWIGQVGETKGFVDFKSVYFCFRAATILLNRYRSFGKSTIRQIICRWAPPSENDCTSYISFVCQKTGLVEDCQIDDYESYFLILSAMCVYEVGYFDSSWMNILQEAISKYIVNSN